MVRKPSVALTGFVHTKSYDFIGPSRRIPFVELHTVHVVYGIDLASVCTMSRRYVGLIVELCGAQRSQCAALTL